MCIRSGFAKILLAAGILGLSATGHSQSGCVSDPEGDATGDGPDVVEMCAFTDGDQITIEVTFADPIDPPGSGTIDEVNGIVQFDADQDPSTGEPGLIELAGEICDVDPSTFGTDAGLDIESYDAAEGTAPLLVLDNGDVSNPGDAEVEFGVDTLTAQFEAGLIGSVNGIVNLSGMFGNVFNDEESFDCVPDSGFLTTDFQGDEPETDAISVPAMSTFGLLLLFAAMLLLVIPRLRT